MDQIKYNKNVKNDNLNNIIMMNDEMINGVIFSLS